MKKVVLVLSCISFILQIHAQSELTLGLLDNVYQASYTNPAVIPQNKISIGVPGLSGLGAFGYVQHHTVVGITDLNEEGEREIDFDHLLKADLTDENYISAGADVNLFHLQLKINKAWWSISLRERVIGQFVYPKEFAMLAADGNAQFEGQTIDLSTMKQDFTHYRELGLGYVKETDKWNFGGRAKILFGIANTKTQIDRLDYGIRSGFFDGEPGYRQYAAVLGTYYTSGIDTTGEDIDPYDYLLNNSNLGLGLDLGVTFKPSDRLEISGSITDLGFITWAGDDNINYEFDGDTSYVGFDPATEFFDENDQDIDQKVEDILDQYDYTTNSNNYTTMLNYRINLGVRYKLTPSTSASGYINLHNYYGLRPSLNLGLYHELKRVVNVAVTNTFEQDDFVNIGLGLVFNIGSVQLFGVTDHLEGLLDPYDTNYLSARFGMNLVFGKVMYQESLPHNF